LFAGVAEFCPEATCCVVTNPVNSTVPIAAEVLKKAGVFEPTRLFGVTTLDVVRASTFTADAQGGRGSSTEFTAVPVIGGHSGSTIVPLFSQAKPPVKLAGEDLAALVHRKCCFPFLPKNNNLPLK
jgi:malate dehydrogenase